MHVFGKIIIPVSMFVDTDNEEKAIRTVIEMFNYYTVDTKDILDVLKLLSIHDVDIVWEETVDE